MSNPVPYYVYRHIRPDTGQPFYIGIGKQGTKRSISKSGRNAHWHNILNLNNGIFECEILLEDLTGEQAGQKETEFIKLYGRIGYDKNGILVNVLKGGQYQDIGCNSGKEWSEQVKRRMSKGHEGNISNTGKICITDGTNQTYINSTDEIPYGWKRGGKSRKPLSDKHKAIISSRHKEKILSKKEVERRRLTSKGNKSALGCIWVNNGITSILLAKNALIPTGYTKGRKTGWDTHPEYKSKTNNYFITA